MSGKSVLDNEKCGPETSIEVTGECYISVLVLAIYVHRGYSRSALEQ